MRQIHSGVRVYYSEQLHIMVIQQRRNETKVCNNYSDAWEGFQAFWLEICSHAGASP